MKFIIGAMSAMVSLFSLYALLILLSAQKYELALSPLFVLVLIGLGYLIWKVLKS